MSPWDALPPHIDQPNEWDNHDDDDHWYTKWRKAVKGLFAYGPRSKHWWARWRRSPATLLAVFGAGDSRWENDILALRSVNKTVFMYVPSSNGFYLSRVQYWCDWHIQFAWPLFFAFHFKYGKKGLVNFYIGAKRDSDLVFWFPAIYIGSKWK